MKHIESYTYSLKPIIHCLIIIGLILNISPLFSQGPAGPPPGNPVPIQGLPFLIISGIVYGVYKTLKRNSRTSNSQ